MFVKVCGLKTTREIDNACELGYDAFGVVVTKKSKRYVDSDTAKLLANYGNGKIKSVIVAYTFNEVANIYKYFDFVQLYFPKKLDNLIFSCGSESCLQVSCKYLLFDKSHGQGKFEKLPESLRKIRNKLIIAGGLNVANVKRVIEKFNPFGVDVSSSLEVNGEKNFDKMKEFICEVKGEN
jgi:phosphoribosylanthranilate isomerase